MSNELHGIQCKQRIVGAEKFVMEQKNCHMISNFENVCSKKFLEILKFQLESSASENFRQIKRLDCKLVSPFRS